MANTPQRSASINELAKAAIEADPTLADLVRGIVKDAVSHARYIMRHGTDSEKSALMKTLMPHMLEALRQTEQSERSRAEKEAYERMMGQLRGDTPVEAGS